MSRFAHYEVVNPKSGHSFGVYEAESAEAAIEACCRDAGYASKAEADEVTGNDSDLIATEVVPANSTFRIVHKRTGQLWSSDYGWVWPGTNEQEATLYDAQDARGPLPEQVRDVGEWQAKTDD